MPITEKIKDTFIVPIRMGSCPLCGEDVYSENDPSDDHSMSEVCSVCNWNKNQFLSWEEVNEMLEGFGNEGSIKGSSSFNDADEVHSLSNNPSNDFYSPLDKDVVKEIYNKNREGCVGKLLLSLIETCRELDYFIIRSNIKEDENFGLAIVQRVDETPENWCYDTILNKWE